MTETCDDLACDPADLADLLSSAREKLEGRSIAKAAELYSLQQTDGRTSELRATAVG